MTSIIHLKQRVYLPNELIDGKVRRHSDLFRQCHTCGQVVPIYELKKESEIKDFVEPSNNPFDNQPSITGLGNKKPKSSNQKQRQKTKTNRQS
jgi:hypothetical protein